MKTFTTQTTLWDDVTLKPGLVVLPTYYQRQLGGQCNSSWEDISREFMGNLVYFPDYARRNKIPNLF